MQKKKLFVQKNLPKTQNKNPYLKLFLWAALVLTLLVILVPFATHQKSEDSGAKKPFSEKGVVVKEIPKPEPYMMGKPVPGPGVADEGEPGTEGTPSTIPGFKSFPGSQGSTASAVPGEKPPGMDTDAKTSEGQVPPSQTGAGQPGGSAPGKMTPMPTAKGELGSQRGVIPAQDKSSVASQAPVGSKTNEGAAATSTVGGGRAGSSEADVAKPAAPAPSEVPKKSSVESGSKMRYVVQVGSFKEKQNAEEMKDSLAKRGYDVVIKPIDHAKLGHLFAVQLQPVGELSKANTLMTQIGHEEKVQPFIIKVPGE